MWKTIKDFMFNSPDSDIAYRQAALDELKKRYGESVNYYCGLCKRGFKTKGATSAHKTIKHKLSTIGENSGDK